MAPSSCDRTRALLSQRLDGAVSEVERRQIDRHTAVCPACRAFEAQSRWLTEELRTAPLLRPSRPVTVASVRARRHPGRVLANVASAAALLVVVVGGYAVGTSATVDRPDRLGISTATGQSSESVFGDSLRALRVDALRAGELRILPETGTPRGVKPALPAIDA